MFVGTEEEIKKAITKVQDARNELEAITRNAAHEMQKYQSRVYLAVNELARLCSTK